MFRNSIWRCGLVILFGSFLSTTSALGEPVKLAVLLPLSNVNKFSGAQAKQGFEMASDSRSRSWVSIGSPGLSLRIWTRAPTRPMPWN